jgi:hypothetical protein
MFAPFAHFCGDCFYQEFLAALDDPAIQQCNESEGESGS